MEPKEIKRILDRIAELEDDVKHHEFNINRLQEIKEDKVRLINEFKLMLV